MSKPVEQAAVESAIAILNRAGFEVTLSKPDHSVPIVRDYICAAAQYYEVTTGLLTGTSRLREIVKMRHTAMLAAFNTERQPSVAEISRAFLCDYATAHTAIKSFVTSDASNSDVTAIQGIAKDVYNKRINKAGIYNAS